MATLADYPIEEIVEMSIWQRLSLYDWKMEMFSLSLIIIYYFLFKLGATYNKSIATNLFESLSPVLKDNFYQVGVTSNQLYAQDDSQNFSTYASGRLRIKSMLAEISLKPRHNLFMWLMESIVSFFLDSIPKSQDLATFEFEFDEETNENFDNFIWAIVTKDNMNDYRSDSYFLSLTKTSESNKLPNQFVFMNEVPEMNDVLFTKKLNDRLIDNVNNLKFLAITDQPIEKPQKISELKPQKKLIVQFNISNSNIVQIKNFISYLLNDYLDLIVSRGNFRPELTRKVKKTRENEYNKLKKQLDDLKREKLNNQKIEEQKKLKSKMTPEEQQKLAKRQQERKQRKQLNRQKVRGSM